VKIEGNTLDPHSQALTALARSQEERRFEIRVAKMPRAEMGSQSTL
jgi:hypothetical protein